MLYAELWRANHRIPSDGSPLRRPVARMLGIYFGWAGSRCHECENKMQKNVCRSSFSLPSALACRCPRCGKGKLLSGFLTVRPSCEICNLDFGFADAGDGPAVFVILLAGMIVVVAALIVEVNYEPPYWVHAALWGPLILVVTLGPLRMLKGLMIALQYDHKAAEGHVAVSDLSSSKAMALPKAPG